MAIWDSISLFIHTQTDGPVAGEVSETEPVLEHVFDLVLTPSDVGDHLHILDKHANKLFSGIFFFPTINVQGDDRLPIDADFFFRDGSGKIWWFTFSAHRRSIHGGWAQFVRENGLTAGDKVSVWREGVTDAFGIEIFSINCQKKVGMGEEGGFSCAHQVFDELLKRTWDGHSPLTSLPSVSVSDELELAEMVLKCDTSGRGDDRNLGVIEEEEVKGSDSVPVLTGFDCQAEDLDSWLPSPLATLSNSRKQLPLSFPGFLDRDDALLYCCLFPPEYEFEREKLVQLWMAQGLFVVEPIEEAAGLFFECHLADGYFEFSRNELMTGKALYKFRGDSHFNALLRLRGRNIVRIEGNPNFNDLSPEVRHLSLRCQSQMDSTPLVGLKRFKQLRKLMFLQGHGLRIKQIPRDFFLSLEQLRALDLSQTQVSELPNSLGNLKCLCYLDVSNNPIRRLPETIDRLRNLQTLKLRGCSNLFTLPKALRKLINLRHLDMDVLRQLSSMPQGMGALTNIRTLSAFLVGVEDECSIKQLKNMDALSGSFCISRLENVLTVEEVKEAGLWRKVHLKKLELRWGNSQDEDFVYDENILSSLKPNLNLKELRILCYGGLELPSWISDPAFSELVVITLFKCENCIVLPSLGQLPSLKVLNIVDFHKLKVIDNNFYGVGSQGRISFCKLDKLTIENMHSLEEWKEIGKSDFPLLSKLMLKHCPNLRSLCPLSSLRTLEYVEISHCPMLASFPEGTLPVAVNTFIVEACPLISASFLSKGSQEWLKRQHNSTIWVDHQEMFGQRSVSEHQGSITGTSR